MKTKEKKEKESHRERVNLDNFYKDKLSQGRSGEKKIKNHKGGVQSDRKKQKSHGNKLENEE